MADLLLRISPKKEVGRVGGLQRSANSLRNVKNERFSAEDRRRRLEEDLIED
jgi:hypothetical protein